jgi:hypothetical protein
MTQNDLYVAYFKYLCEQHPDLVHAEGIGRHVFEVISIEEAVGDFRAGVKIKDFFFRLIMYTYRTSRDESGNVKKFVQGGWLIAKNVSTRENNKVEILETSAAAERLNDHFIARVINDSIAGYPLFNYSLNDRQNITSEEVKFTGDGTYIGWRTILDFDNYFDLCADEPEWLDNGSTPLDLLEEVTP